MMQEVWRSSEDQFEADAEHLSVQEADMGSGLRYAQADRLSETSDLVRGLLCTGA